MVILEQNQHFGAADPYEVKRIIRQLKAVVGVQLVDFIDEHGPVKVRIEVEAPQSSTDEGRVRVRAILEEAE